MIMKVKEKPLIVIAGATASGKSELAIEISKLLDGEIINTDALQFYKGMDIGTAKVPPARREVPHHLLDFLNVRQEASVASFQRLAREKIAEIRARNKVPVAVGGSGLYLRAVTDNIQFPPSDPAVRKKYEQFAAEHSLQLLYQKLKHIDPIASEKIHANDERRIIRALEVHEITGQPFSAFLPKYEFWDANIIYTALTVNRPDLHERVAQRTQQMLDAGLVQEVKTLLDAGLNEGKTAKQAIGYAEVISYLAGQIAEAELKEKIVVGTRKLIRKQDTWFKRDPRFIWLNNKDAALRIIESKFQQLWEE